MSHLLFVGLSLLGGCIELGVPPTVVDTDPATTGTAPPASHTQQSLNLNSYLPLISNTLLGARGVGSLRGACARLGVYVYLCSGPGCVCACVLPGYLKPFGHQF